MLSRTALFLTGTVAVAAFSACSTPYEDVFSYKKTTFKAPAKPATEIVPPPPTTDPFAGQPGGLPPGTDPSMAIPGVSQPAPGIPGLEAAPATPAPAGDPNMTPPPAPGASPIPGLQ